MMHHVNDALILGRATSKLRVWVSLFLLYALKQEAVSREAGFQNGVFLTNQWNPLRKPIYTILKLPLHLSMRGHSKKRDTHTQQ
jgi:hypothetical protein